MNVQRYHIDPPIEPEPPDCAEQCSGALLSIINYLSDVNNYRKYIIRLAALQVVLGKLTPTEACRKYSISKCTIYFHKRRLESELGIDDL